jgi:hypothetical protein
MLPRSIRRILARKAARDAAASAPPRASRDPEIEAAALLFALQQNPCECCDGDPAGNLVVVGADGQPRPLTPEEIERARAIVAELGRRSSARKAAEDGHHRMGPYTITDIGTLLAEAAEAARAVRG